MLDLTELTITQSSSRCLFVANTTSLNISTIPTPTTYMIYSSESCLFMNEGAILYQ